MNDAIKNLKECQQQLDADGCMVGVSRQALDETLALTEQMAGALNFILAFYEPGQTHLDTEAWKRAEASGRRALAASGFRN